MITNSCLNLNKHMINESDNIASLYWRPITHPSNCRLVRSSIDIYSKRNISNEISYITMLRRPRCRYEVLYTSVTGVQVISTVMAFIWLVILLSELRSCFWYRVLHVTRKFHLQFYIDGFVQDCSNISNELELLQSCTQPSIWEWHQSPSTGVQGAPFTNDFSTFHK